MSPGLPPQRKRVPTGSILLTPLPQVSSAKNASSDINSDSSGNNTTSFPSFEKPRSVPSIPPRHSRSFIPPPESKEQYLITFDPPPDPATPTSKNLSLDPWNPQNWSSAKKLLISAVATFTCFCSTFASSAYSPNIAPLANKFHVSKEVTTLSTSLFIAGYAFGPLVWGPLSEVLGRRWPIMMAMGGFTAFSAGAATGKDLQTVLICRFWAGVMGSCPLSVVAGIFGDMYDALHRGVAISGFATVLFVGPVTAPFIGGFTVMNQSLGWRFNGYWILIMSSISFLACVLFLEETYAPVVLSRKAAALRRETGNWALYAKHDEMEIDMRQLMTRYFTRPITMLVQEPVLLLVSFYMSFIYGILYLFFTAYPLVFQGVHGFNPGLGGLPMFALAVGVFAACTLSICMQPRYHRKLVANQMIPVPEWRLPQVMLGSFCFAAGLFWFGWTGQEKDIHWIVPSMSGLLTGFGIISIFMQLFNYLIDTYLMFAASAISANTILRSAFAGGFPMFATYMYESLGISKATTVLSAVATAMIPVPFLFYYVGGNLRAKSKFAPTLPRPAASTEPALKSVFEDEESKAGLSRLSDIGKRLSNRLSLTNDRRSLVQLEVPVSDSLDTMLRQRYREIIDEEHYTDAIFSSTR